MCNGGETCSTCAGDCGDCPCTSALCSAGSTLCCPGGTPGTWNPSIAHCDCYSCSTADDCGASDICIGGRCESAWGRSYRVTAVEASFPAGIDSDDTVPDCYVITTIDGTAHQSPYVDEDYTPYWGYSFDVSLYATSTFGFQVWDWDPFDDDLLFYLTAGSIAVDVEWLRSGTATFNTTDWSSWITYTFEPR
jgi:hypothetical protein